LGERGRVIRALEIENRTLKLSSHLHPVPRKLEEGGRARMGGGNGGGGVYGGIKRAQFWPSPKRRVGHKGKKGDTRSRATQLSAL